MLKIVQKTCENIMRERLQVAQGKQKNYADNRCRDLKGKY